MAEKIMVIGPSGTGKTYAGKFLDPTKTVIICPENKTPPGLMVRRSLQSNQVLYLVTKYTLRLLLHYQTGVKEIH